MSPSTTVNDNINSERFNKLLATGLLQSLSVIALGSVWQALCFLCYVITCFWWFPGKELQVRLMFLRENMVFLDNTDVQGASLYSLEALTIKMLCFIQSCIKSSLAEATGRFRAWGTSVPSVFSSPLRSWGGEMNQSFQGLSLHSFLFPGRWW